MTSSFCSSGASYLKMRRTHAARKDLTSDSTCLHRDPMHSQQTDPLLLFVQDSIDTISPVPSLPPSPSSLLAWPLNNPKTTAVMVAQEDDLISIVSSMTLEDLEDGSPDATLVTSVNDFVLHADQLLRAASASMEFMIPYALSELLGFGRGTYASTALEQTQETGTCLTNSHRAEYWPTAHHTRSYFLPRRRSHKSLQHLRRRLAG